MAEGLLLPPEHGGAADPPATAAASDRGAVPPAHSGVRASAGIPPTPTPSPPGESTPESLLPPAGWGEVRGVPGVVGRGPPGGAASSSHGGAAGPVLVQQAVKAAGEAGGRGGGGRSSAQRSVGLLGVGGWPEPELEEQAQLPGTVVGDDDDESSSST